MVLRPVLWLGLAYITGEALNLLDLGNGGLLSLVLFLEIFTIINLTGRLPMKKYSRDVWLLVLPVFICAGFYNCRWAMEKAVETDAYLEADAAAGAFDKGSGDVRLSGQVTAVEEKENSWYLYISGCRAEHGNMPLSRLLVVVSKSVAGMDDKSEDTTGSNSTGDVAVAAGDIVAFLGTPEAFSHPSNEGMFDEWLYYKSKKVQGKVFANSLTVIDRGGNGPARWAQQLRGLVKDNCKAWLAENSSGVAVSMITGDKSELDTDLKSLYQQSGIAHILAISGLHISFLGMGTYNFFRKLRLPLKFCMAAGLVLTVSYGWFTGMAPSTKRAVIMTGMAIIAKALGYTYDRKTAIGIASLAILIPSPLMATQPGFQLSFIAVGSLALCEELLKGLQFSRSRAVRLAGRTLVPGTCVTLGTMPVIARSFYEIPVYSVLLNLIVIPLMSIVYPAMLVCGFFGGILKNAGLPVYWLVDGILWIYEKMCQEVLRLPGSVVITGQPAVGEIFLIYFLLGTILLFYNIVFSGRSSGNKTTGKHKGGPFWNCLNNQAEKAEPRRMKQRVVCTFLWLAAFMSIGIIFLPRHPSMMTVTMVDVGQGDCFLIQLPSGENILADGGSSDIKNAGKYRLIPFLKSRGIRSLDAVFLSHMDMDHINAVEELFQWVTGGSTDRSGSIAEGGKLMESHNYFRAQPLPGAITIKRVLFADVAAYPQAAGDNYKACLNLARQAAGSCNVMKTGEYIRYHDLTITAVSPAAATAADTNDSSLVLYLTYGSFTMLLTGDISTAVDLAVIENMKAINASRCTILKIAHHGSKTSTSEALLDYLSPTIALISCGKENRYGHPHKDLIERLEKRNIQTYIASQKGEIILQTNGKLIKTVVWME